MKFPTGLKSKSESGPEEGNTASVGENSNTEELESTRNDDGSQASKTERSRRKFHTSWLKLWPWMTYEAETMFCTICKQKGKDNAFTQGCCTFKTSSLTRPESSHDQRDSIQAQSLSKEMNTAVAKMLTNHDAALIKPIKTVACCENLLLSKFESMMDFLKDIGTPGHHFLKVGNRIDY